MQRLRAAWLAQLLNCYWRNKRSKSSVNLIKSENAGKVIYKYIYKPFYKFVHKENDINGTANSNKPLVLELI